MILANGNFRLKDGRLVTIRAFDPNDFERLLDMFQNLSEESSRYGLPPYDRTRLQRMTSNPERDIIMLAFDRNRVVAFARVSCPTLPRLKGIGDFLIYMHQDYQNKALGTFLTKLILEETKRKGFHRISLQAVADNLSAVKCYARCGFTQEGRMRDAFFGDDGTHHDMLIMGKIL